MEQMNTNPYRGMSRKLIRTVSYLSQVPSAYDFIRTIGRLEMSGKCAHYLNFDRKLPTEGEYIEIRSVGRVSERIVINLRTYEIFPTRDHYNTFLHAGKPAFCLESPRSKTSPNDL